MDILKIIKKRRSIRQFKSQPIPEEKVNRLIEALIWAPSAGNLQSRKFYFIFNEKIKEEIAKASFLQKFIAQAPLVVVCCGDLNIEKYYGKRGKMLYMICDVSASIENLLLEAEEEGLGTCWVGAFDQKRISKILNLPKNLIPLAIVPIGYPQKIPMPPPRKKKEELIEFIF